MGFCITVITAENADNCQESVSAKLNLPIQKQSLIF